jgi:hypothetical protein
MLTIRELAELRSDVMELLPDTCRIERPTVTNAHGYTSNAWGTAVVSTACRLDPDTSRQDVEVVAGREGSVSRYILSLKWDVDIQDGDQIVLGGKNYQLTELHEAHSDRIVRRARVSQIRGE